MIGGTIDDEDLTPYGVTLHRGRPPRVGGEVTVTVPLALSAGSVRTGGTIGQGQVTMAGHINAVGGTHPQLLTRLDAAVAMWQGFRAWQLADYLDREWHGYVQQNSSFAEWEAEQEATAGDLRLEWVFPDPFAIARAETVLPGSDVTLALGTAPCPIRVDVRNVGATPITQIVVTVLAGSTALRTLTWTGSLAVGKVWTVSDESNAITNDGASAVGGLSAASELPWASPAEGATRVTVAITGGTGSPVVRYYRRWR